MQDVFLDAHVSDDRIVSHIKLWLLLGHVAIESTSLLLFEEKKKEQSLITGIFKA